MPSGRVVCSRVARLSVDRWLCFGCEQVPRADDAGSLGRSLTVQRARKDSRRRQRDGPRQEEVKEKAEGRAGGPTGSGSLEGRRNEESLGALAVAASSFARMRCSAVGVQPHRESVGCQSFPRRRAKHERVAAKMVTSQLIPVNMGLFAFRTPLTSTADEA